MCVRSEQQCILALSLHPLSVKLILKQVVYRVFTLLLNKSI
jgi:hypothetical protein